MENIAMHPLVPLSRNELYSSHELSVQGKVCRGGDDGSSGAVHSTSGGFRSCAVVSCSQTIRRTDLHRQIQYFACGTHDDMETARDSWSKAVCPVSVPKTCLEHFWDGRKSGL